MCYCGTAAGAGGCGEVGALVGRRRAFNLAPGLGVLIVGCELIRAFSLWEPVADVLDAMPNGTPQEVMPAVAHAIADAMHDRGGLLLRMVFELPSGYSGWETQISTSIGI